MRNLSFSLAAALFFAGGLAHQALGQVTPRLAETEITITVGERRDVQVFADIGSSSLLTYWAFLVDPSGEQALLFPQFAGPLWTTEPGFFAGSNLPGVTGQNTLLGTLPFLGLGEGTITVGLYYVSSEPWQGINVPTGFAPLFLTVHVVPAPSTAVLAVAGLLGFGARRRR